MRSSRAGGATRALAALAWLLAASGCGGERAEQAPPQAESLAVEAALPLDYLVRVGDRVLDEEEFEAHIPAEFRGLLTAEEKQGYLDRWVDTQLLYLAGVSRGLLEDPEIAARLAQQQREFVANHLLQRVLAERVVVTESDVSDYYAEHLDEYSSEYRYREIVVRDQHEAEQLCDRLQAKRIGFIRTAEQHSLASSSRVGGDMGWLAKGAMPPEVEERIVTMEPGEISRPFETAWGWTIIQFREKRRAQDALALQDVKDEILRYLTMERRRKVYREFLEELRESFPISYHPRLEARLKADEFAPVGH